MRAATHVRIFLIATFTWVVFWIAGLPSYYQQYSRTAMIVLCVALTPALIAIAYAVLRPIGPTARLTRASWLAFYFTIPLAFYDWLYCGVHLGFGMRFLIVYWYLTAFYILPWIVLPATAVLLDRARPHSITASDRAAR